MPLSFTENQMTDPLEKSTGYRIVNHKEAGLFDSMTGATLWALKNLKDWEWQIEPVAKEDINSTKLPVYPDEGPDKPRLRT